MHVNNLGKVFSERWREVMQKSHAGESEEDKGDVNHGDSERRKGVSAG